MKKTNSILVSLTSIVVFGLTGCGGSGDNSIATNVASTSQLAGWYGKTQISAIAPDDTVYTHNTAGIFGELQQSIDTKDANDLPGFGEAILQIVFPQTTWGEDNGDYFSDYQSFTEDSNKKRVWTFQIKNQKTVDLKDAPIKITLEGTYDITYLEENGHISYKESTKSNTQRAYALTLIDVDNHRSYTQTELPSVDLNMDGMHIRTFRWVKGDIEESDFEPLVKAVSDPLAKVSGKETGLVFQEVAEDTITGFGRPQP